MSELSNSENTLNVNLEVEPTTSSTGVVSTSDLSAPSGQVVSLANSGQVKSYDEYKTDSLKSETPSIPKVSYTIGKKVLSLDVETTGLNPWEYKTIVCSVWDLDEPKGQMKTFADWDEEKLITELFDYISSKNPEVILAFNAKFECRCFITRAMLYHIRAPWIWTVEWHDMMTMLEGGWKNGLSGTMPAGSEENWLKFFFNETKPYTIDQCFEGIRNGSLEEMIMRNRTCVQGQGDMYQLFMYCQASEEGKVKEEKPSAMRISEMSEAGLVLVPCTVCEAVNEVTNVDSPGQCWRCSADLPKPTAKNVIKEIAREIDWSKVGLTEKKSTASSTTTKKSTTTSSSTKKT